MKKILFILGILLLLGCRSAMYNMVFKNMGVYDDSIVLDKISNGSKEIVFLPMHHLGTESFYNDVSKKTDSLLNENYMFYKEYVTPNDKKDSILRIKAAKLIGMPPNKKGYEGFLDSVVIAKNLKLKKKLINQTEYPDLNLTDSNSIFSDPSLEDIIGYYESNAGEILVNECDLEHGLFGFFENCPKYKAKKKWKEKAIQDFRNHHIIDLINKDSSTKIALIYGSAHVKPIKDSLMKLGYK